MISLEAIITLAFIHLVADWFVQTNWQAHNKSKNFWALSAHVATYTLCFVPLALVLSRGTAFDRGAFLLFTFVSHWLTDAITSQYTTKYWFIDMRFLRTYTHDLNDPLKGKEYEFVGNFDMAKRKNFFVTIGVDQFIHTVTLAWSFVYFFPR